MLADMHMHSSVSDGTDTPRELIAKVQQAGIQVFALTDHDTIDGVKAITGDMIQGLEFHPGVEFSCRNDDFKCHILGYDFDYSVSEFEEVLTNASELRNKKLETRISFLKNECDIEFTDEELKRLHELSSAGKPHLARLLMKKGVPGTKEEIIKKYLYISSDTRLLASEAISAILSAGGTPIWAHPLGGEGEKHIGENEFRYELERLAVLGIKGFECYYSRYSEAEIKMLISIAKEKDMLISGGSDYHGSNKNIRLGQLNKNFKPVPAAKLSLISYLHSSYKPHNSEF